MFSIRDCGSSAWQRASGDACCSQRCVVRPVVVLSMLRVALGKLILERCHIAADGDVGVSIVVPRSLAAPPTCLS